MSSTLQAPQCSPPNLPAPLKPFAPTTAEAKSTLEESITTSTAKEKLGVSNVLRRWTAEEDKKLLDCIQNGHSIKAIADNYLGAHMRSSTEYTSSEEQSLIKNRKFNTKVRKMTSCHRHYKLLNARYPACLLLLNPSLQRQPRQRAL